MSRPVITTAAVVIASALLSADVVLAQGTNSISRPASTFQFGPTGVKTQVGELMAAGAYGDFTKGMHGTFIRMPAGFASVPHTHTEDYFGIVIQGIGVNEQDGGNNVQLPVGSYWFQKGKERHVTKCVSSTDCLFFIYQPGKFDYVPAH